MLTTPARRFLLAILCAAAAAGCDSAAPTGSPSASDAVATEVTQVAPPVPPAIIAGACQFGAVVFDVGPVALCQKAIVLAVERLGPVHRPVSSITFRLDMCPPNAPCAPPLESQGWVIFTFTVGAPVMVHVGPLGGASGVGPLVADVPVPVPGWLAAEMVAPLPS